MSRLFNCMEPVSERSESSSRRGFGDEGSIASSERMESSPRSRKANEWNKMRTPPAAQLAALATGQGGNVTRRQLLDAGLSSTAIATRVRRGDLHRRHHAVYGLGHQAPVVHGAEFAAVLACGEGAVVSHESAAAVWCPQQLEAPSEVTLTVVRRKVRPRGITVHRVGHLDHHDIRHLDGLAVTSPARTVLDLAAINHSSREAVFAEMLARRMVNESQLEAALKRAGRRRGASLVRALIGANQQGFTRSKAERRLRRLCRTARLPAPVANVKVAGYEVDLVWPEQRLVVEFDSFQFHGHRAAFERDRRKDQVLMTAGYRVVRVTWRQLIDEPLTVLVVIAGALGAGPSVSRDAH